MNVTNVTNRLTRAEGILIPLAPPEPPPSGHGREIKIDPGAYREAMRMMQRAGAVAGGEEELQESVERLQAAGIIALEPGKQSNRGENHDQDLRPARPRGHASVPGQPRAAGPGDDGG
jgi:hypothetical protein